MSNYHAYKIRSFKSYKTNKNPNFKKIGVLSGLLIVIVVVLYTYVLPRAEVIIVPKTQNKNLELALTLSDGGPVNLEKMVLPTQAVEETIEKNETFDINDVSEVGEVSSGQARFYNKTGKSYLLKENQELLTESGTSFLTTAAATVPAAKVSASGDIIVGELVVAIKAKQIGEAANEAVGRLDITGLDKNLVNKVYGEIKAPLVGGWSKQGRVVSADIIAEATSTIVALINEEIETKYHNNPANQKDIITASINFKTIAEKNEPALNEESNRVTVSLTVEANYLVYDRNDWEALIRSKLKKDGAANWQEQILKINNFDFELDQDKKIAQARGSLDLIPTLDFDKIRAEIVGLSTQEARRLLLTDSNIKDTHFVLKNSLFSRLPYFSHRVLIKNIE